MMPLVVCPCRYAAQGGELEASLVFGTISLINLVRIPLVILPILISNWASAVVAFRRLSQFLLLPENQPMENDSSIPKGTLFVENGNFHYGVSLKLPPILSKYEKKALKRKEKEEKRSKKRQAAQQQDQEQGKADETGCLLFRNDSPEEAKSGFELRGISFRAEAGQLVEVVGATGSGKTSLLLSLLGVMQDLKLDTNPTGEHCRRGLKGSIAYVPQTAWMQDGE